MYSNAIPTDLQSSYWIEYKENATGATTTTIEQISGNAYHDFVASTFTNSTEYLWRIRLKDTTDQTYSTFSDWVIFKCSAAPVATILYPSTDGQTVTTDIPTFLHSFSDAEGTTQKSFYYQVYKDDETTLVWTSDVTYSTDTQMVIPSSYLENNTYYKVRVIVEDADNISGTSTFRRFYVDWSTPSIDVDLTISDDSDNARFYITWSDTASLPGYYTGTANYLSSGAIFNYALQFAGTSGEKLYWDKSIGNVFTISNWFRHRVITRTIIFLYYNSSNYIRFAYDATGSKFYCEVNNNGAIRTLESSMTTLVLNNIVFWCLKQTTTGVVLYTKINSGSVEKWGDI